MGKARYSTHPAFSKTTMCGKNQWRDLPQEHHRPDPHFGLHKKTTTLRTSGTCSGRSSAVGAMAKLSLSSWVDVMNMCIYHLQIRFLYVFVELALVFWGPNSKDEPQGGDDEFLAAMFFPQWNVLLRNIRDSEAVIENMNENITQ